MTRIQVLQRCLAALRRPTSLAALLILVTNDHVLRWLYPSWLTGKASDLGWLYLAPLVTAFALAWAWPNRIPFRPRIIEALAFGGTAGIFALGKTVPVFNHALNAGMRSLTGLPLHTRVDPTDLLALIAGGIAWVVWKSHASPPLTLRRWHLLILPAFAMITIANTAGPDYGIIRLGTNADQVIAISNYGTYTTADGGLTWTEAQCAECGGFYFGDELAQKVTLVDPQDPTRRWTYVQGESIQMSTDGGQTWRTDIVLQPVSEAQQSLVKRDGPGVARFIQGPFDATIDPGTGNLIFAMGHEGVLVRLSDGAYRRAAVGQYTPPSSPILRIHTLLLGELILALDLSVVALAFITRRRSAAPGITVIAWLVVTGSIATLLIAPPALSDSYDALLSGAGITVVTLACLALTPFLIVQLKRHQVQVWPAIAASLIPSVAFAMPFILWAMNAIPSYRIAATLAAVSCAISMVAVARHERT